tara:strand:+ start:75 stop:572 length:498 start_codon:yes stop_codon:yes gene_type:complete
MSKRSRRRNKKILGALLLGGLGLAARKGTGTGVSGSDKAKFTSDAAYSIPKGDEGSFKVQDVKINVPRKKPVVNLGRMTGSGPESGLIGQKKRANYVQRIKDSQNADMMRAIRSDNAYRGDMMTTPRIDEFKTSEFDYFSKGGRVKKRNGAAKRGFGRAFKGGKK